MATQTLSVGMLYKNGNTDYKNPDRLARLEIMLTYLDILVKTTKSDYYCFLAAEYSFDKPLAHSSLDPSTDTYKKAIATIADKVPSNCIFVPGTMFIPKESAARNWVRQNIQPGGGEALAVNRAMIWRGNTMRTYDKQDESARSGSYKVTNGAGGEKVFPLTVSGVGTVTFGLDICKEHGGLNTLKSQVDVHMLVADGKSRQPAVDRSRKYFLQCNSSDSNGAQVFKTYKKSEKIDPSFENNFSKMKIWENLPI